MPSSFEAHNPRAEAQGLVGPDFEPVVLEPSPPAITDDFFADDPAATVGAHTVVAPDGRGDISWDEWLLSNPDHTDWVAERWLGGDRTLFAFDQAYIDDPARPTLSLSFKDAFGGLITDLRPTQTRRKVAARIERYFQSGTGARRRWRGHELRAGPVQHAVCIRSGRSTDQH